MNAIAGLYFPPQTSLAPVADAQADTHAASVAATLPEAQRAVLARLAEQHGWTLPQVLSGALVIAAGAVNQDGAAEAPDAAGEMHVVTASAEPGAPACSHEHDQPALDGALRAFLNKMGVAHVGQPVVLLGELRQAAQGAATDSSVDVRVELGLADGVRTATTTPPASVPVAWAAVGVSVFDNSALQHSWSTSEMRGIFCGANRVAQWLRVEAALALAQASLGIIPPEAGEAIAHAARLENVDPVRMAADVRRTSHSLVGCLKQFEEAAGPHGEFIHFGATTQDILDTGLVLQLRQAHAVYLRDVGVLGATLARLAEEHRDTPMVGRTHGMHALPITFGHKVAIWLDELSREFHALRQCEPRVFVGMMVGAVGTQAGFGEHARQVEVRTLEALGLGVPHISWAPARDRLAEYVGILARLSATLSKIGNELFNMQRNEFGEVAEVTEGKVGSSTMPHKINPALAESLAGLARHVEAASSLMTRAMGHEGERDNVQWKSELKVVPDACLITAAALQQAITLTSGLTVNTDAMRRNLDIVPGYLLSERVMLALGEHIGKQTAHRVVHEATVHGLRHGLTFAEAMEGHWPEAIGAAEREALVDPSTYLGEAGPAVDRVLEAARASFLSEDTAARVQ